MIGLLRPARPPALGAREEATELIVTEAGVDMRASPDRIEDVRRHIARRVLPTIRGKGLMMMAEDRERAAHGVRSHPALSERIDARQQEHILQRPIVMRRAGCMVVSQV